MDSRSDFSRAWFRRAPAWDDCPPIFRAVEKDGVRALRSYVEQGGSLRVRGPMGGTLTFYCTDRNDLEALRFLIKQGAPLGLRNPAGQTELHVAAINRRADFVRLLVRNKVKLTQADIDGKIPLHCCCMLPFADRPQLQTIRELVRAGTPVDFPNRRNGKTALHLAVLESNAPVAKLLLKLGANPAVKDRTGKSVVDVALKTSTLKCWASLRPRSNSKRDWYFDHAVLVRLLLRSN